MNTSVNSISTLELTTAEVLAFPTSTEPPSTVYPQKLETLAMMKANAMLFIIDIQMNHGLKECCNPCVRSSGVMMCPMYAVA